MFRIMAKFGVRDMATLHTHIVNSLSNNACKWQDWTGTLFPLVADLVNNITPRKLKFNYSPAASPGFLIFTQEKSRNLVSKLM